MMSLNLRSLTIVLVILTLTLLVIQLYNYNWIISSPSFKWKFNNSSVKSKRILFWGTLYDNARPGLSDYCIDENSSNSSMDFCPYKCEYTTSQTYLNVSDAIVIHGREKKYKLPSERFENQRWIFLMFESPDHSWTDLSSWNNIFNWTMSYRRDSDVFIPYGSVIPRQTKTEDFVVKNTSYLSLDRLRNKKLIAWAASNCNYGLDPSERRKVVDELSKFVPVDIYGHCGPYKCPVITPNSVCNKFTCHEYLGSRYKFYLSLENSICREYITEKFFNALKYNMIPVVYGPSRKYYEKLAPPKSFIHVEDFKSVQLLAKHLLYLDSNPEEYLKYFEWRKQFTVDKIYHYTRGWCNLCKKLHLAQDQERSSYASIRDWWFYQNDPEVQGKPCEKQKINYMSANGMFKS